MQKNEKAKLSATSTKPIQKVPFYNQFQIYKPLNERKFANPVARQAFSQLINIIMQNLQVGTQTGVFDSSTSISTVLSRARKIPRTAKYQQERL